MDSRQRATAEGTARFRERFAAQSEEGFYRGAAGLHVSSVGLGTYLGELDPYTDDLVTEAVVQAVGLGCNVVDTAISYRHQRAERCVGRALAGLLKSGAVARDEIVVSTKGGYIPYDTWASANPSRHILEEYILPGLLPEEELVGRCHCLNPDYLADQLDRSLHNLGLDAVDVYYLHNPETQLDEVPRPEFLSRVRAAFEMLEEKAREGKIGIYGTATWTGYRARPEAVDYLSLAELDALAREAGGEGHHFRALQLPVNLMLNEAVALANQEIDGERVTLLEAAARLGMSVFASAPLGQAHLAEDLPAEARAAIPGLATDAQRALQAVRSVPGIACVLCGMKRPSHVEENLALRRLPAEDWSKIVHLFR